LCVELLDKNQWDNERFYDIMVYFQGCIIHDYIIVLINNNYIIVINTAEHTFRSIRMN